MEIVAISFCNTILLGFNSVYVGYGIVNPIGSKNYGN